MKNTTSRKRPDQGAYPDPRNHYLEGFEMGQRDMVRGEECPEEQRSGGYPDYWRGYEYALQAKRILAAHGHTMKSWLESIK